MALAIIACTAPSASALKPAPPETGRVGQVHLELALLPTIAQQQIEGPSRDDEITRGVGITTLVSVGYHVLEWLEPALVMQFDAGSTRRATFGRPGADGVAAVDQLVEGSYWELWLTLMVRARIGAFFGEVGWSPLILREDDVRTDLPNTRGETDGVFTGSRAVAWTVGVGAQLPLNETFELTLRMQFRIRYLVERGGFALADDEETGQMLVWPTIGVLARL